VCTGDADGFLKLWDLSWFDAKSAERQATHHSMQTLSTTAGHQKDVNAVAFSPDNSLICSGSQDKVAKLWRVPSLAPVGTLRGHSRGVWSVAFSPVDQVVVTASGDKTLRLWSTSDCVCLRSFEGHTSSVLKSCFISLGVQLVSSGADGLIKVWNVRTAECMSTLDEHEDKVWALSVANQGDLFVSGSGNGEVLVWKDYTSKKAMEQKMAEADLIAKEQKVSDAMYRGNHSLAFKLALDLKYPAQLYKVISAAVRENSDLVSFWDEVVNDSLSDDENLKQCLQFAAEWNTNAKFYLCGQVLLENVFARVHPDRLSAISGLENVWDGLLSYSQRHAKRINTLVRSTYLLDYILSSGSTAHEPT